MNAGSWGINSVAVSRVRLLRWADKESRIPSQPGFVAGQGLIEELLPRTVQGHGMVAGFSDVQTNEYVNILLIQNQPHTRSLVRTSLSVLAVNGGRCRHPRYKGPIVVPDPLSCLYQRSTAAKLPPRSHREGEGAGLYLYPRRSLYGSLSRR